MASSPKPTPKSSVKPSAKFPAKATARLAAKPAVKPAAKPATKLAVKPVAKPAVKPAAKPVAKPIAKPVAKPAARLGVPATPAVAKASGVEKPPAKAIKVRPLLKKQLQHFEKRLIEERKRVLKELGHHEETFEGADREQSAYSFHMADQGTDAMEREKAFLFASQEGRFLWHIDQALRRLYRSPETFGICHGCGQMIAVDRLDALPHARYCINCKQKEEDDKQKKG